jgi:hypothetical protein
MPELCSRPLLSCIPRLFHSRRSSANVTSNPILAINPSAWLIEVDDKYLDIDGTISVTHHSASNIAECWIIAYADGLYTLEIGLQPNATGPWDPPAVYVEPGAKQTQLIGGLDMEDPLAAEATLGNWDIWTLNENGQDDTIFALNWTVPGLGYATFQLDGESRLWAVFDGETIAGATTVNLTITSDD